MNLFRLFLLTCLIGTIPVMAQESKCNNETVIKLKNAGLSDEIIMSKVASENCEFDTSADALLKLKEENLSDELISLMIENNAKNDAVIEEVDDYLTMATVQEKNGKLLINDHDWLDKGDKIQIFLPVSGRDFLFVNRKKSKLGTQLIGGVADAVGSGAVAVGLGSSNIKVMQGAIKVMHGAHAVERGADALEKINDLDISKDAKKIAGKEAEILDWDFEEEGYLLEVKIGKKKYEIDLEEAITTQEVKLIK
ncbi:hypothetical protein GO491_06385 [Flavobacteriaceae bacterium Ap0902]|nr:hypothetical protein [Flavobacteriaceae bacterium Ap0902]